MNPVSVGEFIEKSKGKRLVIDSRKIRNGDIFVALKGERFDGNEYVEDAVERGASYVITRKVSEDSRYFTTEDSIELLKTAAKIVLNQSLAQNRIAITGSNGKTTTKICLASMLSDMGSVYFTEKNYNTEIGVPLSILNNREQLKSAKWVIFECGTNSSGDIKELVDLIKPDVSVLLNVGTAHLGKFEDREALLEEKLGIFSELKSEDIAVAYSDDKDIVSFVEKLSCKKYYFGIETGNQRLVEFYYDNNFTFGVFENSSGRYMLRFKNIWHRGQLLDFLAASTVLLALGIEGFEISATQIELPFKDRFSFVKKRGITIINDCYNSSLESVRAAIETIKRMSPGKTIAVVGSILEQGTHSENTHEQLGKELRKFDCVLLYTKDRQIKYAEKSISPDIVTDEINKIVDWLSNNAHSGTIVYFKASRGIEMENLVNSFLKRIS
ncbi:MAG: UDP-N-acetylmuramoyl-tripeptide--D-alanyl-D-alanine ligase [Kosmotogaceae bacterium]